MRRKILSDPVNTLIRRLKPEHVLLSTLMWCLSKLYCARKLFLSVKQSLISLDELSVLAANLQRNETRNLVAVSHLQAHLVIAFWLVPRGCIS